MKTLYSVLLREIGQSDKEQEKRTSIGMYRYDSLIKYMKI